MPRKPQWFQQLPQIVEELSALNLPVIDRAILERLFGLSRRGTINLMARFGGYQLGKTYLIDRQELIRLLTEIQESEDYRFEQRRRQKLVAVLEKIRKHAAAAKLSIPIHSDVYSRRLADLPEGVSLAPGQLTIIFDSAEDVLGKLFELAQAISNDFEQFRKAVEQR